MRLVADRARSDRASGHREHNRRWERFRENVTCCFQNSSYTSLTSILSQREGGPPMCLAAILINGPAFARGFGPAASNHIDEITPILLNGQDFLMLQAARSWTRTCRSH